MEFNNKNGKWSISLDQPIYNYFATKNNAYTIILTETVFNFHKDNGVIFCIDMLSRRIAWKKNAKTNLGDKNTYVGIKYIDNSKFYAWDSNGFREIVDTASGEIISSDFFK